NPISLPVHRGGAPGVERAQSICAYPPQIAVKASAKMARKITQVRAAGSTNVNRCTGRDGGGSRSVTTRSEDLPPLLLLAAFGRCRLGRLFRLGSRRRRGRGGGCGG